MIKLKNINMKMQHIKGTLKYAFDGIQKIAPILPLNLNKNRA